CRHRNYRRPTPARHRCSSGRSDSAPGRSPAFFPKPSTRRCRPSPGCRKTSPRRLPPPCWYGGWRQPPHGGGGGGGGGGPQHKKPLGKVLHRFRHRAGHVHQAKHDRFGVRSRHPVEPAISDIDRVDIGDDLAAPLEALDLACEPLDFLFVAGGLCFFQRCPRCFDFGDFRPPKGYTPAHAIAQGARHAEVGWRSRYRVASALQIDRGGVLQALFDEVRQFEILEEHVEELFLGQCELERVLAAAIGAALAAALSLAAGWARDLVAPDILLVARDDVIGFAGAAGLVGDGLWGAPRRGVLPLSPFPTS